MSIILIRHGKTSGNLRHAYIGCGTDEPLCAEGIAEISALSYPAADRVFVSPMKRCAETAHLIYPNLPCVVVDDLRECDFGDFEGMTYAQLNGNADYQRWIDSGGEIAFPNGESKADFAARCVAAFESAVSCLTGGNTAFIVHGGTIMAIMEKYASPHGTYYDFQTSNGKGYILESDGTYRGLE